MVSPHMNGDIEGLFTAQKREKTRSKLYSLENNACHGQMNIIQTDKRTKQLKL